MLFNFALEELNLQLLLVQRLACQGLSLLKLVLELCDLSILELLHLKGLDFLILYVPPKIDDLIFQRLTQGRLLLKLQLNLLVLVLNQLLQIPNLLIKVNELVLMEGLESVLLALVANQQLLLLQL